jgi:CelD/BcsL family acetyltransferase involved in cellulose biosynthesis
VLRLEVRDDLGAFEELADWWNEQPGPQRSVFMRAEWFRVLAEDSLGPGDLLQLLVFRDGERPVAVVPTFLSGRRLRSLTELSTEEYDMIFDGDPDVAANVIDELTKRSAVRFEALEETSPLVAAAHSRSRWLIDYETRAGYVDLSNGLDAVSDYIGKRQRSNLRRGIRHLEEEGELRMEPHPSPDRVFDVLERCLDLEHAGWKGEAGVSVRSSDRRLALFSNLARIAQDRGWLRLGTMYLDDRLVAFNYDLEYAGRLVGILTSYDETLSPRCSVGHVLLWKTLEVCADRGVVAYDLGSVGGKNAWKLRWAAVTTPRLYVTGFGDNLGGLLGHGLWKTRRALRSLRDRLRSED